VAQLIEIQDGEQKTKPIQNSLHGMVSAGVSPDLLVCRSVHVLNDTGTKT
jgi:CTP synthase (UTP-ammonia lyase)